MCQNMHRMEAIIL